MTAAVNRNMKTTPKAIRRALGPLSNVEAIEPTHQKGDLSLRERPHHGLLTGVLVMSARSCCYPPAIDSCDLLEVDFDRRSVGTAGGLFLVEWVTDTGVTWRGCRRFAMTITHDLQVDETGSGDWQPIDLRARRFRIVGMVLQVYKPSRPQ